MHEMKGEVWVHIEICNYGPKDAVLNATNLIDESLGPRETSNSGANQLLFCMHKTTGEVLDPWRLVILALKTLF